MTWPFGLVDLLDLHIRKSNRELKLQRRKPATSSLCTETPHTHYARPIKTNCSKTSKLALA